MQLRRTLCCFILILVSATAFAQQTGSIRGTVTSDGAALPGATVEARSAGLPQARVTTTDSNGEYRLPVLPPGQYTLTFSLSGLQSATRNVQVLLDQEQTVDASLGMSGIAETITVTAEQTMVDQESTEIESALPEQVIDNLPMRQEYRDLLKLIPAVQYSEDAIRGPSAGGSGQDNVYLFDGVNVSLPLYGNLSADPATHDVAQFSMIRGGAKATDFNRAGGFMVDSVSKSGSNEFRGGISYQIQNASFAAEEEAGGSQFEEDKSWATLNLGGPILRDRLFFYGSYYRPDVQRDAQTNFYGDVPDLIKERNELFGKLTFTPTNNILLNGSYRNSDRTDEGTGVTDFNRAGTSSDQDESTLKIGILEGSWVVNNRSFVTAKFNNFENETSEIPDRVLPFTITSRNPNATLPLNDFTQLGLFVVPTPLAPNVAGAAAFNEFIAPIVAQYGYDNDAGVRTGGGRVGVANEYSFNNFYRDSAQIGYDFTFGQNLTQDIHVGFQWYKDIETLRRTSNGWGRIEVPGGRTTCTATGATACTQANLGQAIFYQAIFQQQTLTDELSIPDVRGEFQSKNIEINDTLRWNDWAFNLGVLVSNDTLYGTGLRESSTNESGYVLAPGNKYEMYDIPWEKMIQPRVGATWAYNTQDTVYVSYARYNPAASSLPRAASWDRSRAAEIRANFDRNGNLLGYAPLPASSGKFFVDDLDPRYSDEYLIGTAQQFTPRWSARAYARHRYSSNFWEDVNNTARTNLGAPSDVPNELYIDDLTNRRQKLCQSDLSLCGPPGATTSGSSYVIAELDGAFTKYYEATLETDWRSGNMFLNGTYTWAHYYGNFDQDNTTTVNDASSFIGSSFIADGPGRQIWDNRYGDLRGDRRHLLKAYGYYTLPWNATTGAFAVYQSGQPWEAWNAEPYRGLPGWDADDTSRYAEPAGRRRTDAHYQLDLNYTQNVPFSGYNLQLAVDLFNVFDKQTGYNVQNKVNSANFGTPRTFFDPRRFQLAVRFEF